VQLDAQAGDLAPQRWLAVVAGFSASTCCPSSGFGNPPVGMSMVDTGFAPPTP